MMPSRKSSARMPRVAPRSSKQMPEIKRGPGRPKLAAAEKAKRRNLSITDDTLARAKQIGEGNASEGIRRAVAAYK